MTHYLSHRLGWDKNMLFTPDIDIFGDKLEVYRNCFSKPQWRHFKTYINGLILGEKGEKNIQDIISNTLDGRSQSSLKQVFSNETLDGMLEDSTI
ncbi:MAG TPA: hypothetical protein ENI44_04385 [Thermoplasmatales archaeon]|nr:hypothetical protein [Thermoplasmatales archaeon]